MVIDFFGVTGARSVCEESVFNAVGGCRIARRGGGTFGEYYLRAGLDERVPEVHVVEEHERLRGGTVVGDGIMDFYGWNGGRDGDTPGKGEVFREEGALADDAADFGDGAVGSGLPDRVDFRRRCETEAAVDAVGRTGVFAGSADLVEAAGNEKAAGKASDPSGAGGLIAVGMPEAGG